MHQYSVLLALFMRCEKLCLIHSSCISWFKCN